MSHLETSKTVLSVYSAALRSDAGTTYSSSLHGKAVLLLATPARPTVTNFDESGLVLPVGSTVEGSSMESYVFN